ncbi:MAG TPA: hypothetical protein DCE41_26830 [Cytophagales bacterium]|nr:hypothetical protein [Cytophagales bacterium]HAA18946.1 hypothetical protein [Cytophagales bacterium]HAP65295.1 hypothetical protein [Cytophagales bacterium]
MSRSLLLAALCLISHFSLAQKYILVSDDPNDTSPVPDDPNASFEYVADSLKNAYAYILNQANQLYNGSTIQEPITVYIRQSVFSDHNQLTWAATSPTHTMKIMAYPGEEVIFNGQRSNGELSGGWLKIHSPGRATNVWIEGITVEYFMNAISLGKSVKDSIYGADSTKFYIYDTTMASSHNTIKNNIFRFIGSEWNSKPNSYAFSAIGVTRSQHNVIDGNIFYRLENDYKLGALHAVYFAHGSINNEVRNNYVTLCSGDAFRVRDRSHDNVFENNYVDQSGANGFFSEWYNTNANYLSEPSNGTILNNNTGTFPYPGWVNFNPNIEMTLWDSENPAMNTNYSGSGNFVEGGPIECEEIGGTATGDLDGDGVEEVWVAFNYDNFTKVVRSEPGKGPYLSKIVKKSIYWHVADLEVNDFDGDGNLELIVAYNELTNNTDATQIHRYNAHNSGYLNSLYTSTWWTTGALTSGDYDGNGTQEAFVAFNAPNNSGAHYTQVWKGNGYTSLGNYGQVYTDPDWTVGEMTSGDYDGNGEDELFVAFNQPDVTSSLVDDNTKIWKWDGTTTPVDQTVWYSSTNFITGAITSGDYDGNGEDEVYVAFNDPYDGSAINNYELYKGDGELGLTNLGLKASHGWWRIGGLVSGNLLASSDHEEGATFFAGSTATQFMIGTGIIKPSGLGQWYRSEEISACTYPTGPVIGSPVPRGGVDVQEDGQLGTGSFTMYPNPFTSETTLQFSLAEGEEVVLEVIDLTGKRAELVREWMPAGVHRVNITEEQLPSASQVFITRLSIGEQTFTQKMIRID